MASTDFILVLGKKEFKAPKEFVLSCTTFTSMFEDTGESDNNIPIPITDLFSIDEVNQYIKLFMDLNSLKVLNKEKVEISYLDYIIDYREEFINYFTKTNRDPPHCERLFEIYNEVGEENLTKMLQIDGFFNNLKLRQGIMLLIAAFIRKGSEEKVNEIISSIMDVIQNDN